MTHNLSEGKTHEPRPYLRGSVRRASGFVLTGYSDVRRLHQLHFIPQHSECAARCSMIRTGDSYPIDSYLIV